MFGRDWVDTLIYQDFVKYGENYIRPCLKSIFDISDIEAI